MRFLIYHLETFVQCTSFMHALPERRWWDTGSLHKSTSSFEKTAGLFRPTSPEPANITQHCKKLHVENITKEVKKKKRASWAESISIKCGKPNWAKFAFGCKGKPEGLWFCFTVLAPWVRSVLGRTSWWVFVFSIISQKTYNLKYIHTSRESSLW